MLRERKVAFFSKFGQFLDKFGTFRGLRRGLEGVLEGGPEGGLEAFFSGLEAFFSRLRDITWCVQVYILLLHGLTYARTTIKRHECNVMSV